jgi:hypothetical protein
MFGIGLAGCLLVIPITAYRLFSVLFEKDSASGAPAIWISDDGHPQSGLLSFAIL